MHFFSNQHVFCLFFCSVDKVGKQFLYSVQCFMNDSQQHVKLVSFLFFKTKLIKLRNLVSNLLVQALFNLYIPQGILVSEPVKPSYLQHNLLSDQLITKNIISYKVLGVYNIIDDIQKSHVLPLLTNLLHLWAPIRINMIHRNIKLLDFMLWVLFFTWSLMQIYNFAAFLV